MKTNNAALLAIAALASQAAAEVQMDVRYSDNMIDVGNMDLFAATWQVRSHPLQPLHEPN